MVDVRGTTIDLFDSGNKHISFLLGINIGATRLVAVRGTHGIVYQPITVSM